MPGRKTIGRKGIGARRVSSVPQSEKAASSRRKEWTCLMYLCGDNHLAKYLDSDFEEICRVGSLPNIHVVVQHDRPDGARRYLLPEGPVKQPQPDASLGRVNTGDPKPALDFFLWGIENAPSERVAVILNGPGINPNHVVENVSRKNESEPKTDLAEWVEQHLFSICHDKTSADALETWELRTIFEQVSRKLNRPIDFVGLDMGAAAFVEIAYQMEGLVRTLVASQQFVPDNGWPYDKILTKWQAQAADSTQDLARSIVNIVAGHYAGTYPEGNVRIAALDLTQLEPASRALDTLALALMQSLGDWHVLDAVKRAANSQRLKWIKAELPEGRTVREAGVEEYLPAVDLFELLECVHQELDKKSKKAPEEFGQRERVRHLADLAERALKVLRPQMGSDDTSADHAEKSQKASKQRTESDKGLLLSALPRSDAGLSILLPTTAFNLAESNYLDLTFSQRVHWAALIGTIQLIDKKPHLLWRLISSMLADAGGPAREMLMQRLLSQDSVVEGWKRQFQSLGKDRAITLSLDPRDALPGTERRAYRLLLESTVAGATVAQHESRAYQGSLDTALNGLAQLLNSVDDNPDVLRDLEAFGRTLGEDVIQDLADRLEAERMAATEGVTDITPHLRLQIPSELMPYPWELMYDRCGMLCERYAMGRQVFMETQMAKRVMRRKPGPIQVLVIGDPQFTPEFLAYCARRYHRPPSQLRGAQKEARLIVKHFEQLAEELTGLPPLRITQSIGATLTVNEFRRQLREGTYDIIHYAGHACFDTNDPDGSAWLLSDGLLRAREIRNTLAWTASPPWLVFANACEAGMDAGASAMRYRSDVSGLASAFINQAVAAYIAPLWPVDDEVAMQMAADFYRALLLDRASIGEALRQARVLAKQEWASPPRAVASWSSMVLYGDPTPRLLESLWTPHAERGKGEKPETKTREVSAAPRRRAQRLPKATVEHTIGLVSGPGMQTVSPEATRGEAPIPPGSFELKLFERNGVRYWATADEQGQAQPLSKLGELLEHDKVRGMLGAERGFLDYAQVVGRWIVGKITGSEPESLVLRLVEEYDRETVTTEQLLMIDRNLQLTPLPQPPARWDWLPESLKNDDRVLLIIHGTFSKTESPVKGLGAEFFDWAYKKYRGMIGFDHWTLSKSPEDNARMLWDRLDPRLQSGGRLDIITHSRGGLVARAFVELLRHNQAVRRVVFVGTPNAGTNLANPDNWGRVADWLINCVHLDQTGVYGKLSGLLARLLVSGLVAEIPGLQAQNPSVTDTDQFLPRLQQGPLPQNILYAAVAANYEPAGDGLSLKGLQDKVFDVAVDAFYGIPNDLVVNTASVWAVDTEQDLTQSPTIPPQRLLLFNPEATMPHPPNIQIERLSGIHHTNLFTWEPTRNFLRQQLT